VLRDDRGHWLVAGRPAGGRIAWEFPGGKRQPDESPFDALRRELREELGVEVESATPLHRVPFGIGRRPALLEAWLVDRAWRGTVRAREGQPLGWVTTAALGELDWLPPDRPIAQTVRLPRRIALTPDVDRIDAALDAAERALGAGAGLLILRLPRLDPRGRAIVAAESLRRCREAGALVLAHADPAFARAAGLDGVHLPAASVRALRERPLPAGAVVTAACHDVIELLAAVRLGCDAVLVSPVCPTPTHPSARPIGWDGFAELARRSPLPAYALGGVGPDDLDRARAAGGFGVAGIRAFAK
jgi:8-oxo-dGTP diphosphatase